MHEVGPPASSKEIRLGAEVTQTESSFGHFASVHRWPSSGSKPSITRSMKPERRSRRRFGAEVWATEASSPERFVKAGDAADCTKKSLIDSTLDLPPHGSSIPQDLVHQYPHNVVPSLDQIPIAALIMLAAFVGLMMLTINFNDQLQCHATEIDGVRWDWVFTTKLLISTTAIAQHLPDVLRKLVRGGSLITSKLDRVMVTLQFSVHVAPVIRRFRLLAPSSPALLPLQ